MSNQPNGLSSWNRLAIATEEEWKNHANELAEHNIEVVTPVGRMRELRITSLASEYWLTHECNWFLQLENLDKTPYCDMIDNRDLYWFKNMEKKNQSKNVNK